MKILLSTLVTMALGIGAAQAQLASDSPAPTPPATSTPTTNQPNVKNTKLASDVLVDVVKNDSLKTLKNSKVPAKGKKEPLASEALTPKPKEEGKNN